MMPAEEKKKPLF